jgi:hypothetical protein
MKILKILLITYASGESLYQLADSLTGRLRRVNDTECENLASPEDTRYQASVEWPQNVDPEVIVEISSFAELRYFENCLRESYRWIESGARLRTSNNYHSE